MGRGSDMPDLTVLVVAPASREILLDWAGRDLIGRCLVAEQGVVTQGAGAPALLLPHADEVVVGDVLSHMTALDHVRVVWCGAFDGTSAESHPHMEPFLSGLRAALGQQELTAVAVHPSRQPLPELPRFSPNWLHVVVGPEQPVVPGRATSTSLDPDAAALHVACQFGGVLGGNTRPVRLSNLATGEEYCATGFTSLVTGGRALHEATSDFLSRELPLVSAGSLWPSRYTESNGADLIESAHETLRNSHARQLSYTPLPPGVLPFSPNPRITLKEFRANFGGFVRFLFLHSKSVSWGARFRNQVADGLQGANVGWELERVDDQPGIIPMADAEEIDAGTVADLELLWREAAPGDGVLPGEGVWHDLIQCACGIIDGGGLPDGMTRPEHFDVATVVPPRAVLAVACQDDTSGPGEELAGSIAGVPHEPATPVVAQAARNRVIASLGRPQVLLQPLVGRGSRVTEALTRHARDEDERERNELAEELGDRSPEPGTLPLLDRLRADVLADGITARLDADRWFRIAVGPFDQLIPVAAARFWFALGTGTVLSTLMVLANLLWSDGILTWLANYGIEASAGQLWGVTGTVSTLVIVGPVVWFYFHFLEFHERSRRQSEARWRVFARARHALAEAQRLRSADRILRHWCTILRGVHPLPPSEESADETGEEPWRLEDSPPAPVAAARRAAPEEWAEAAQAETAPAAPPPSLSSVELTYPPDRLRAWLARHGAFRGWRATALRQLLDLPEGDGVMVDNGLPNRPLAEFAERMEQLWTPWLEARVDAVWHDVKRTALTESDPVEPEPGITQSVEQFCDRITSGQYVPGVAYGRPPKPGYVPPIEVALGPEAGAPLPDVIRMESRLYMRVLERREDAEDAGFGSEAGRPGGLTSTSPRRV